MQSIHSRHRCANISTFFQKIRSANKICPYTEPPSYLASRLSMTLLQIYKSTNIYIVCKYLFVLPLPFYLSRIPRNILTSATPLVKRLFSSNSWVSSVSETIIYKSLIHNLGDCSNQVLHRKGPWRGHHTLSHIPSFSPDNI